jgi:hypothetical protein
MRIFFLIGAALLFSLDRATADNSPLFHECMRGSDNQEAVEKSRAACTVYLAQIMKGIRFGIVTKEQLDSPFCIPRGELTDDQWNLLFAKIKADNPNIKEGWEDHIAAVVVSKAHRCSN